MATSIRRSSTTARRETSTRLLAEAIAEGAGETGAEVRLRRVQELAPEEAIQQNQEWAREPRRDGRDRRGRDARRPRVGARSRVRDSDPFRQSGRPAQAVPGHGRRPVVRGRPGRQGRHHLHVRHVSGRRAGVDDPRPQQRLRPLGLRARPAGLHEPVDLRGRRQTRTARRSRPARGRPRTRCWPPRVIRGARLAAFTTRAPTDAPEFQRPLSPPSDGDHRRRHRRGRSRRTRRSPRRSTSRAGSTRS